MTQDNKHISNSKRTPLISVFEAMVLVKCTEILGFPTTPHGIFGFLQELGTLPSAILFSPAGGGFNSGKMLELSNNAPILKASCKLYFFRMTIKSLQ